MMTALFKNLITGLDEVEAFLASEKNGPKLAAYFHSFHNPPDISTQIIRSTPLRPPVNRRIVQNNEGEILPKKRAERTVNAGLGNEPRGPSGN